MSFLTPNLLRLFEAEIFAEIPHSGLRGSAREVIRIQRQLTSFVYTINDGRINLDMFVMLPFIVPECFNSLYPAALAAQAFAEKFPLNSAEASGLRSHANALDSILKIIQDETLLDNKTDLMIHHMLSALEHTKEEKKWIAEFEEIVRKTSLLNLPNPVSGMLRHLVFHIARRTLEGAYPVRVPSRPVNNIFAARYDVGGPLSVSYVDIMLLRSYAADLADYHTPWLGYVVLKALEVILSHVRTASGEPLSASEWLSRDLKAYADDIDSGRRRTPRDPNSPLILEVSEQNVLTGDVSSLNRIFTELEEGPRAHRMKGIVVISFRSFANDPRPDYLIPEVRRFLQTLYGLLPHFLYYVLSEPEMVGIHLLALLTDDGLNFADNGSSVEPNLSEVEVAVFIAGHLVPVVAFAERTGMEANELLQIYTTLFPQEVWKLVLPMMGQGEQKAS